VTEPDESALAHSAVVFSPHFDEETLGCGGTIIKKKQTGADVKLVFMTDGSKSHRHLIPEDELKAIRAKEGFAAGQKLGLHTSNVYPLGFEEARLSQHLEDAISMVTEIFMEQQPEEVSVTYHKEPLLWSEDHLATNLIVLAGLKRCRREATVYEYPIWFWRHWPWVELPIDRRREIPEAIADSLVSTVRLLRDFRHSVYVGDVLDLKCGALEQHRSQMIRLVPDPRWPTLGDVSNGEFLGCFFQVQEVFHRYVFSVAEG
jgi:LmbE family N-acetylglucosaminyl deacetylase